MKTQIEIRSVTGGAELRAVENLQKEVWGVPDLEVVPATHFVAAQAAGGVLLGAFDGENLAGFVYGFVGCENGKTTHHSHLLAVKPAYRNHNLGERLKRAQAQTVLRQGITTMTWTFDPLQSLNAHFNFNKLGVVSDCYLIDFYGADAASFLHRNSTDRLWATWRLDNNRSAKKVSPIEIESIERLVRLSETNQPQTFDLPAARERVAIEIPANINELQTRDRVLAAEWRAATRQAFTVALARGFVVKEFYRASRENQNYGAYLLDCAKEIV